jgi:hypothetical protein
MLRYAILNNFGMVERIKEVSQALANPPPSWILIADSCTNDIIGKYYVNGEFVEQANTQQASVMSLNNSTNDITYTPVYSTYEIYRKSDVNHDLEQDLGAIETDIANLETGKADAEHTHSQYATTADVNTALSGKSDTTHNHDTVYAPINHTHAEYATNTALSEGLSGKADSVHTHSQYATTDAMTTALSGKSDTTHIHATATETADGFMSKEDKAKLNGVATGANNYVHPASHSADMITGLADVATSGSYNDLSDKPTIPTTLPASGGNADTVDGKHATDFATATHTHSDYATNEDLTTLETTVNGKANVSHIHSQSDITGLSTALSGKADATHTHSDYALATDVEDLTDTVNRKANATHTHSQSDITGLETALSNKANVNHTHSDYVTNTDFETLSDTVDGKANVTHTHAQSDITGLTTALSGKANTNHTHSNYALVSDLNDLSDTVDGKSNASHTHTLDEISDTTGYVKMTAAERTKLSGIATGATKTTIDSVLSTTSTNPVQNKAVNSALSGKVDKVDGKSLSTNDYTTAEKNKLAGIATGANAYTHPTYTAKTAGLYKITVDGTGHISGATAVSKSDITDLGIPSTNTTYSVATTSTAGLMSSTDKSKLDGIATGANNYTHPTTHPVSMITGLSDVATSGSYNDLSDTPTSMTPTAHTHAQSEITGLESALSGKANTSHSHSAVTTSANGFMTASDKTKLDGISTGANKTIVDTALSSTSTNPVQNKVINTALAGKASTSHTHNVSDISGTLPITKGGTGATTAAAALTNLGVTATAAELNKMDGVTATTAELNYVDGVTSNIQTQLNGKAASGHNHNSAYIAKSLQMTANDGDVEVSWTDQDVVAKIKALGSGFHTAYAKSGTTNNPKTTESWRFMVHKTGSANYGWVMAFGAYGSVYTGYVDNGTWKGWKCIFDASPAPLWTGKLYMSSPNSTPQTVTPSKKLSECRNGWLLLWSDYDKDTSTANDSDFVTTMIPKKNPTGGNWGGKAFYCDIPRYIGSDVNDVDTERRIIKSIYIHDDCIKGSFNNDKDERNDVVLRAVMEY